MNAPESISMIRSQQSPASSPASRTAPPAATDTLLPSVGLLALDRQYAVLRESIRAAIDRVCDSGRFVLGPDVAELEKELARELGVPHVISCGSGSDALLLALMALDIQPGDEVILPSYTFFATARHPNRRGCRAVDPFQLARPLHRRAGRHWLLQLLSDEESRWHR